MVFIVTDYICSDCSVMGYGVPCYLRFIDIIKRSFISSDHNIASRLFSINVFPYSTIKYIYLLKNNVKIQTNMKK